MRDGRLCRFLHGILFRELLVLYEVNVVVSGHSITLPAVVPGGIRDLLHFKQRVWSYLIFNLGLLILPVQELSIVLFWVHQADILFEFLLKRLWEGDLVLNFVLLHPFMVRQKFDKDVVLEEACLASPI